MQVSHAFEPTHEHRQDFHLTSTGLGHHYRPGYYFPDSGYQREFWDQIPPELAGESHIRTEERFITTTGTFHDNKFPLQRPYRGVEHKKPPAHYNVHYNADLRDKLQQGGHRRPLTMNYCKSETRDEFDNKSDSVAKARISYSAHMPHLLADHHHNGPSKQYHPAGDGRPEHRPKGNSYYARDSRIYALTDPYMTTTHMTHRPFQKPELDGIAKKDVATYWDCEGYPKAHGFGLKTNPVPKDAVPREPLPMIDRMVFKHRTKVMHLPQRHRPVPNTGLRTETQEQFIRPSDPKMKNDFINPLEIPFYQPTPDVPSVMQAPQMYHTEYENVGSGEPVKIY